MTGFNWPDLIWLIPAAAALITGASLVTSAAINRRADPFARLKEVLDKVEERGEAADKALNDMYAVALAFRDHAIEWEDWHEKGMPDPPGKPVRPDFIVRA